MGRWRTARGRCGRRRSVTLFVAGLVVPALATAVISGAALAGSGLNVAAALAAAAPASTTSAPVAAAPAAPAAAATAPAATAKQALSHVGSGWALAMYAAGPQPFRSRVRLYLTSPAGATYGLHTWRRGTQWQLQAWSPDGRRAIFATLSVTGGATVVHQLALATGATTSFTLSAFSRVIGYGLPAGRSVLVAQDSGIYLYSLTGARIARLSAVSGQAANLGSGGAVMSRGGQQVVVPARSGLSLVSRAGILLRSLPVPHTSGPCLPVRWSSAGVVIASCTPLTPAAGPQVFRVPVSGAAPTTVTPVETFASGGYGDIDAWTIAATTYAQAEQSCGAGFLGRLSSGAATIPVEIPGSPESTVVDEVYGTHLLLTETGCQNRNMLAVLTVPAGTAQTILPYGRGAGAFAVVPYDSGDGQP